MSGKLLCLHGTGGNSEVFRYQLGALAREIEDGLGLELTFVDGQIECSPLPGITDISGGPYLTYVPNITPTSQLWELRTMKEVFEMITDIIDEEGPFEGLMGFSQGACIAMAFLLYRTVLSVRKGVPMPFKYSILFSGRSPLSKCDRDLFATLGKGKYPVEVPTLFVVGEMDEMVDAKQEPEILKNHWARCKLKTMVHKYGHKVPMDQRSLAEVSHFIRVQQSRSHL